MESSRDRIRSDRSRERAQRRRKNRDFGEEVYNDQNEAYRADRQNLPRDIQSPTLRGSPRDEETYSQELPPMSERVPERRHKKKSRHASLKQPPIEEDGEYVNAPFPTREEYLPEDDFGYDDQDYDDQQYDEEGSRAESRENYPEGSVSSRAQRFPSSTHRNHRSSVTQLQGRNIPASMDSLSNYGRQSTVGDTPRSLGGEDQGFWNPDVVDDLRDQQPVPEAQTSSGFQKFLSSFRRFRRPKAPIGKALVERNGPGNGATVLTRIIMLDGEEISFHVDRNETGHALFAHACQHADLVETDYFGLTYVSNKLRTWFWLDPEKKVNKQLRNGEQWLFSLQVKFYPPEPTLLQEDITRYQLVLQVRQDIYTGKLPCSWVTQALLGSFMVQAELGDYDERECGRSTDYLKEFEFVPSPTPQLLQKIAELHKTHVGMQPNQADIKYLETAKRLELYGVDLHPVRDMENVEIYVGVGFHGIVIYRDRLRIGRFAWPKVLRISYKKNNFYLKIRPDNAEPVETVIGFRLLNHHMANRLWKAAVEHHAFFRLKEARSPRGASTPLGGSSYNYTGHTFFQYRTMNISRPHPHFDRSLMKRRTASMPMGLNKAASMHTLNRAHPRDMTVGRTQETDSVGRSQSGSVQPLLNSTRHAGSTGQLYPNRSRAQTSEGMGYQGSSSVFEQTSSYASAREAYEPGSDSHEYVNRHQFTAASPVDESVISGSLISEASSKYGHGAKSDLRRPNIAHYPTTPKTRRSDYRAQNETSQSTNRQLSAPRRPSGGVPALGGVMLTNNLPLRGPTQSMTYNPPSGYDSRQGSEELVDASLEYDDEEMEDGGREDIDYPRDHHESYSQSRLKRNLPVGSIGRPVQNTLRPSAKQPIHGRSNAAELML